VCRGILAEQLLTAAALAVQLSGNTPWRLEPGILIRSARAETPLIPVHSRGLVLLAAQPLFLLLFLPQVAVLVLII